MDNKQPQGPQLQLEINPQLTKVSYSNLAIISHSRSEFVIDLASNLPGMPKALVETRTIMTPEHAKRLMNALFDNVSKYEAQFGVIDLSGGQGPKPQGGATFDLGNFDYLNHTVYPENAVYDSSQKHWIAALKGDCELLPTKDIALQTQLLQEGIYISTRLGREVTADEIAEYSVSKAIDVPNLIAE